MARITVEDCIDKFPSRFELVLVASHRARKLHSGEDPLIKKNNDKNTVIALREIADSAITVEDMKENLIQEYQTVTISDEEEENLEIELGESPSNDKIKNTIFDSDDLQHKSTEAEEENLEVVLEDSPSNDKTENTIFDSDDLQHKSTEAEEEMNDLISSEDSELEEQYEINENLEDKKVSEDKDAQSDMETL